MPWSASLLHFFRMHAPPASSILQRMMSFANPPNSPRFKPYHSKQKADNEVWNWIKFQFLHFPFSFVNRTQCCAMIAMQARSRLARSILWCKCIDILKKIHCMMQRQIKHQKYFHSKGIKHREKGNIGFWACCKNLSKSSQKILCLDTLRTPKSTVVEDKNISSFLQFFTKTWI